MSTCNRLDLQTLGSQPIMPKNLPDRCLEPFPWCRGARVHIVMVLGAISGATLYRPSLPPGRVGNGLHSISGLFKSGLRAARQCLF